MPDYSVFRHSVVLDDAGMGIIMLSHTDLKDINQNIAMVYYNI